MKLRTKRIRWGMRCPQRKEHEPVPRRYDRWRATLRPGNLGQYAGARDSRRGGQTHTCKRRATDRLAIVSQ